MFSVSMLLCEWSSERQLSMEHAVSPMLGSLILTLASQLHLSGRCSSRLISPNSNYLLQRNCCQFLKDPEPAWWHQEFYKNRNSSLKPSSSIYCANNISWEESKASVDSFNCIANSEDIFTSFTTYSFMFCEISFIRLYTVSLDTNISFSFYAASSPITSLAISFA